MTVILCHPFWYTGFSRYPHTLSIPTARVQGPSSGRHRDSEQKSRHDAKFGIEDLFEKKLTTKPIVIIQWLGQCPHEPRQGPT